MRTYFIFLLLAIDCITSKPQYRRYEDDQSEARLIRRRPCVRLPKGQKAEGRTFFDWTLQAYDVSYNYNYIINCNNRPGLAPLPGIAPIVDNKPIYTPLLGGLLSQVQSQVQTQSQDSPVGQQGPAGIALVPVMPIAPQVLQVVSDGINQGLGTVTSLFASSNRPFGGGQSGSQSGGGGGQNSGGPFSNIIGSFGSLFGSSSNPQPAASPPATTADPTDVIYNDQRPTPAPLDPINEVVARPDPLLRPTARPSRPQLGYTYGSNVRPSTASGDFNPGQGNLNSPRPYGYSYGSAGAAGAAASGLNLQQQNNVNMYPSSNYPSSNYPSSNYPSSNYPLNIYEANPNGYVF